MGQLVPDEPTIRLWRENIQAQTLLGRFNPEVDNLVMDGIPRCRAQAEMLSDTLDVRAVFNLKCGSTDKLIERLQRRALRENRLDDANLETIRQRLSVYDNDTAPVLDYYGESLVHTIDSTQSPINVLRDILRVLATLD